MNKRSNKVICWIILEVLACTLVLFLISGFSGCAKTPEEQLTGIKLEIFNAQVHLESLTSRVMDQATEKDTLTKQLKTLKETVQLEEADQAGKQFILHLKSKKSSFSLDPFKHAADSAHAVNFSIPVSRAFYEAHDVGDLVGKKGTPWARTWGSIKISVTKKEITD